MIKVMIADDQELIRDSLKVVLDLNQDMEVTGTLENGRMAVEAVRKAPPDVILMDVRMPELDGVACTRYIKAKWPAVRVIILTTFDDDEYVYNALKYGASGYLLKGVSVPELTKAVRTVAAGGAMINPDVAGRVVKRFSEMAQQASIVQVEPEKARTLTRTERHVAVAVGRGLSNREIAAKLYLSEGTIRNNLSSVLAKLDLRDRTQLAIWVVQTGLAAKAEL